MSRHSIQSQIDRLRRSVRQIYQRSYAKFQRRHKLDSKMLARAKILTKTLGKFNTIHIIGQAAKWHARGKHIVFLSRAERAKFRKWLKTDGRR